MLLDKLYADFVTHTGLNDSIYKTVFIKISEVLNTVKDISWQYLRYTETDAESEVHEHEFDFTKLKKVPRYVIEVFQNVFLNYYTLPKNTVAEIGLFYKGAPYKIINTYDGTTFPPEIEFIDKYKLYNMFILNKLVYDIFGEFDNEFKFIDSFKTDITDIFSPLKNKFEKAEATLSIIDNGLSGTTVADTQLTVETLQKKMSDLLNKLDEIRKHRDTLIINRHKLFQGVNSRDSLLVERDKLSIEHSTLAETRDLYMDKCEKVINMLTNIDAELTDLNYKQENGDGYYKDEIRFLVEKKGVFEQDKNSLQKSISDFTSFVNDIAKRVKECNATLGESENFTTNDVETIDSKLKAINTEQENYYGILQGLEAELKHQKNTLEVNSMKMEKASGYSDLAMQGVENSAILNHLSIPPQPISVTTVVTYLKYYFAYNATIIANDLLKTEPEVDTYIAQAIASKIVLAKFFGVYFNQLFSAANFSHSRIGSLLVIYKEEAV